jgi:ATP/maltotriose-dependent transcriptional regulator MalT
VLAGRSGDAELDRVRVMAESMMRIAGDAIYLDAVATMSRAAGETRLRLARAHQAYARAAVLFNQDDFTAAGKALAAVGPELSASGSPFSVLADVHAAATHFVEGRYAEADAAFTRTEAAARSRNYLYAAARSTWFRGLIAYAQTRMADAQTMYEDTLATFERMGDVEQSSMAHILLSGIHDLAGNTAAEWRHRQFAIRCFSLQPSRFATSSQRWRWSCSTPSWLKPGRRAAMPRLSTVTHNRPQRCIGSAG